jgi:amino acid transporter
MNLPEDPDTIDLQQYGYRQQLQRSLGNFSSFAVAFSLISVFTGIFANFGHGLRCVGGGIVGSWLVVLAGQLLVALVLAELSQRMPLSGYGYQWSTRLTNPHVGFWVGWLLLMQFLTGFPGVCATLSAHLGDCLGPRWSTPGGMQTLTLGVIGLTTIVHLAGLRWAAALNNVGVWTEMLGVAGLSLALIGLTLADGAPVANLWVTTNAETGMPAGVTSWALSLLVGAWCLTGFEAAADLAEETHQPRRTVPRAILTSLLAAGVSGALLLAGLVWSMEDLTAAQGADNPLLYALEGALGSSALALVLVVVGVSVFVCGLASMAATSRLLFAMARDRMLPWSGWLAAVDSHHRTPRNAILLVWAVASAVVVVLPRLEVVTQISAVAGYLGYAGIVAAALFARGTGQPRGTNQGLSRKWIGWAALVWTLGVVVALTAPPTPLPGISTQHLPAWSTASALGVGAAVYWGAIRGRVRSGEAGPPR